MTTGATENYSTLIRGATILTMDPAAGVLERGDLLIENGLVAALESAAERLGPVPRSALGPAS